MGVHARIVAAALLLGACTLPNPNFAGTDGPLAGGGGSGGASGTGGMGGGNVPPATGGSPIGFGGIPGTGGIDADASDNDGPGGTEDALTDEVPTMDSAADADSAPVFPPDAAPECGSARPPITGVTKADGLAIAPDGTLYYSTNDGTDGYVGRLLPNGELDSRWRRIDREATTFGLAYDSTRKRLYFAGASTGTIYVFELAGPTPNTPKPWVTTLIRPNDLAVAADGSVYVSEQNSRHIYRKALDGEFRTISASSIGEMAAGQSPAGLAFGRDGALYVGIHNGGRIFKLTLDGGVEALGTRDFFGTGTAWGNGLAFDSTGRLFVAEYSYQSQGRIYRMGSEGGAFTAVGPAGAFAGIAFGRGALRCEDLYVAQPGGTLVRVATEFPGLPLP